MGTQQRADPAAEAAQAPASVAASCGTCLGVPSDGGIVEEDEVTVAPRWHREVPPALLLGCTPGTAATPPALSYRTAINSILILHSRREG